MAEKRFTTDNGSHEDVCLVDNLTKKEYESNFEDIVDLMNELAEENRKLKYQNEILSDDLEQAVAVINKKWDEYLRKKGLM